jgi:hypothetical protein
MGDVAAADLEKQSHDDATLSLALAGHAIPAIDRPRETP